MQQELTGIRATCVHCTLYDFHSSPLYLNFTTALLGFAFIATGWELLNLWDNIDIIIFTKKTWCIERYWTPFAQLYLLNGNTTRADLDLWTQNMGQLWSTALPSLSVIFQFDKYSWSWPREKKSVIVKSWPYSVLLWQSVDARMLFMPQTTTRKQAVRYVISTIWIVSSARSSCIYVVPQQLFQIFTQPTRKKLITTTNYGAIHIFCIL